jgi:hypothetical protein
MSIFDSIQYPVIENITYKGYIDKETCEDIPHKFFYKLNIINYPEHAPEWHPADLRRIILEWNEEDEKTYTQDHYLAYIREYKFKK